MGKEYEGSITLPSKGLLYGDEVPEGQVNCTAWGAQEEQILTSPSLNLHQTISRLIKSNSDCSLSPEKLLLVDRWALFIYMRCLSWGGAYSFAYRCQDCSKKMRYPMDLEKDLEVIYADNEEMLKDLELDTFNEPLEVLLPVLGSTIGWRMLRGSDETAVDRYVKRQRERGRRVQSKGVNEGPLYRLALRLMKIDDDDEPSLTDRLNLVRKLKGKDLLAIRRSIEDVRFGLQDEIYPVCDDCGWENEVVMPLDKTFFRPPRVSS